MKSNSLRLISLLLFLNVLTLNRVEGATATSSIVRATVHFSATDPGVPINPEFCGLSYEKTTMSLGLFVPNNAGLIKLFNLIGPGVFRIGANWVDKSIWNGLSVPGLKPVSPSQVDQLAGFIKATRWRVIYAVNFSNNTPANAAAEARYVAKALGPNLLGFEIGNECDLYSRNGIRPKDYKYEQFLAEWRRIAEALRGAVPGAVLTGPASATKQDWTEKFAHDEAGIVSMTTQHYYRANGQDPRSTLALLLKPDPYLAIKVKKNVAAAAAAKLPLGFRDDECGSFYHGGAANVSDAYGTALWTLDFMFINALSGCRGVNFHGGGDGPGYTPIADRNGKVVEARPEFYGLKLFSLASRGAAIPAKVSLDSPINFTAYGVRGSDRAISAILINKEVEHSVQVEIDLGRNTKGASAIVLTGPALNSTTGYTLGGMPINPDGTWNGHVQAVTSAKNGKLTITVPPINAVLLNPAGWH